MKALEKKNTRCLLFCATQCESVLRIAAAADELSSDNRPELELRGKKKKKKRRRKDRLYEPFGLNLIYLLLFFWLMSRRRNKLVKLAWIYTLYL